MSTKDLAKATVEELLQLAQKPLENTFDKRLETAVGPVKYFIISDGLKDGTEKIPSSHVYARYIKWVKNNGNVDLLSIRDFSCELKKYFKRINRYDGVYYLMSPEGFDMSPHALQESRAMFKIGKSNAKDKSKKEKKDLKIKKTTYYKEDK